MKIDTISRLETLDKHVFIKSANKEEDLSFGVSEFAKLTEFNNFQYENSYAEFLSRKLCTPRRGRP